MDETTALLRNKMDKLVATLQAAQPAFYNEYHNCRKIITTGVRHTMLEGEVRDSITNEPIYEAIIYINELNIELRTNLLGIYQTPIDRGIYTLTFKMEGYEPMTISAFEIKRGETVRKSIALKRITAQAEEITSQSSININQPTLLHLMVKELIIINE